MPSIQWNRQRWGKEHRWPAHGDEWSYLFGSAAVHWQAFLLPRIHRFLPKFETGAEKYRWLMESLFIGVGARHPDRVVIDVHQVL